MDKQYTLADAQAYRAKHAAEIGREYDAEHFPDVPKLREIWQAGCFLTHFLRKHGCQEKECRKIGFVAGQRAAHGDPWEWALKYLNEFLATGQVQDQPGEDLSKEIFRAVFERAN